MPFRKRSVPENVFLSLPSMKNSLTDKQFDSLIRSLWEAFCVKTFRKDPRFNDYLKAKLDSLDDVFATHYSYLKAQHLLARDHYKSCLIASNLIDQKKFTIFPDVSKLRKDVKEFYADTIRRLESTDDDQHSVPRIDQFWDYINRCLKDRIDLRKSTPTVTSVKTHLDNLKSKYASKSGLRRTRH